MSTIPHPAINVSHLFAGVANGWAGYLRARMAKPRHLSRARVSLSEQESTALMSFRGGCVECIEGCLWLTHDGDCRDIVLEAGQSHVADRDSRLVIHALARSTVRLDHAG
jgi:Protein of unknown function (DUF2917)